MKEKNKKNWDEKFREEKREKDEKRGADGYDSLDFSDEIKRLNRVVGQVEGVKKMLEDQRRLDDVLIQCKAVHSALKSIEQRIIRAHLETALEDIVRLEKKKSRAERVSELEELFRFVA